jgi:cation diffusion facilitator CzcD-associated flavoprotein CzcO
LIRSVGIIGAGFAGVTAAKVLKSFGYDITIFEKEAEVGGVWASSRRYPGLTTQNQKRTYELSDYPMPDEWPEWPLGPQVQSYIDSYTRAFGFADDILLDTEVTRARYDADRETWTVTSRTGGRDRKESTSEFDLLIVANGIFCKPLIPSFRGADEFIAGGGVILHTSEFNDPELSRGKDVLVVGYGKSSCDVAQSTVGISRNTTLVARTLTWKIPKFVGNRVNSKYIFMTRMSEALFPYIRLEGFEKWLHGRGLAVRNAMMNTLERIICKQCLLVETGLHPNKRLETIARSTVSLVTPGFYENVRAGRLAVRRETAITELRAGKAVLSSGETLPVDMLVCGTGWKQEVAFLPDDVVSSITDANGDFRLYKSILPVDVPRLLFNGYNSSFFSQLNAEIAALWIVEYLSGGVKLPSRDEMNRWIDRRLAWMIGRTDGRHSHGTNIIPFSMHQIDELLKDIDLELARLTRLKQWFVPVIGPHFRKLTKRLLARHGIEPPADPQRM